jgi:DNA-binding GntR family transcriptional regulator
MSRRKFDALDEQIHDLFITASTNRYLIKNYNEVKNRIIIFRNMDRDQIDQANREHIQLLKAILQKDKTHAVQTLRGHIERVTHAIL